MEEEGKEALLAVRDISRRKQWACLFSVTGRRLIEGLSFQQVTNGGQVLLGPPVETSAVDEVPVHDWRPRDQQPT